MLLGVYWYYGFPESLYHFDYFTYRPGIGGASGGPTELRAMVQAPNPTALLDQMHAVTARYPDVYLDSYAHGPLVRLQLDDWALTDYTFHLAGELEQVLRQRQATPSTEPLPTRVHRCCAWPSPKTPRHPTATATANCKPSVPAPENTGPRWRCCASTATCR